MEQLEFFIDAQRAGTRIDRALTEEYADYSRSYLQTLLKELAL